MADIDRLAGKIVDRILRDSGFVAKGAGSAAVTRASLMPYALTVAAGIAEVEDQLKKSVRQYRRTMKGVEERLDRNGERIRELAERHGVPAVTEVARGFRDFSGEEFGVGLVPKRAVPEMNGHHKGDGVAPVPLPTWHPEAD